MSKKSSDSREIKAVSFNLESDYDKKLLEHSKSTGLRFSNYVKNLIEKDMNSDISGSELAEIKYALNNLTTLIKENGVKFNNLQSKDNKSKDEITVTEENDNSAADKETENIINSLLNLGN